MVSEEREVFVDTKYPVPAFVDGINYISPDAEAEEEDWEDTEDEFANTVFESEQVSNVVEPPIPIEVVDEVVVYPVGGAGTVNAVLVIEEVTPVADYEIRIVPR